MHVALISWRQEPVDLARLCERLDEYNHAVPYAVNVQGGECYLVDGAHRREFEAIAQMYGCATVWQERLAPILR